MKRIAVYTANFGKKDVVAPINKEEGVDYFCYTDCTQLVDDSWTKIFMHSFGDSPRRTARWVKTMPHVLLREYDYTIWIDGRIELTKPIQYYIDLLKDKHIASLKHPVRDCLYDEAKVCSDRKLNEPRKIEYITKKIRDDGYPQHN